MELAETIQMLRTRIPLLRGTPRLTGAWSPPESSQTGAEAITAPGEPPEP